MSATLIAELHSAAATLRAPTSTPSPAEGRITAELLERAAERMQFLLAWNSMPPHCSTCHCADAPAAPAWSEFPAWVNYIAMDSDGRWHGFGQKPYVEDSFGGLLMGWDVEEGGSMAYRDRNAPHVAGWRVSLRERPEASA